MICLPMLSKHFWSWFEFWLWLFWFWSSGGASSPWRVAAAVKAALVVLRLNWFLKIWVILNPSGILLVMSSSGDITAVDSMVLAHIWVNSGWIFFTAWRKTLVGRISLASDKSRSFRSDRAFFYCLSHSSVFEALAERWMASYLARTSCSEA